MALVKVPIRGKHYELACDDGQEQHLLALARDFEKRVGTLAAQTGCNHEHILFAMAGLMLTDEAYELQQELEWVRAEAAAMEKAALANNASAQAMPVEAEGIKLADIEQAVAETIEDIADRIDRIAEKIGSANAPASS